MSDATSPYLNRPLRTIEQARTDREAARAEAGLVVKADREAARAEAGLVAKPMTATGVQALAAHIYKTSDNGRRK